MVGSLRTGGSTDLYSLSFRISDCVEQGLEDVKQELFRERTLKVERTRTRRYDGGLTMAVVTCDSRAAVDPGSI